MPKYSGKRKRPAFPRVGRGEDFPARKPGTRVGETVYGDRFLQPTRATVARRNRAAIGLPGVRKRGGSKRR